MPLGSYRSGLLCVRLHGRFGFAAEPGDGEGGDGASDSLSLRFPVRPTVAPDYESLARDEFALDLDTPSNVVTEVEYDPESGCYIVRTKVGDWDIATPFMLTPSQYYDIDMRHSMQRYFQPSQFNDRGA